MANYYYVKNSIKPIPIGFEGENDARTIVFDISRWIEDYGNGTALLVHQRPGDAEPYPCATEQKAGTIEWAVQQADLVTGGYGRAQISYKVGDNIVARSPIYKTVACASISAAEAGEPGQDWINDVLDAAAQAETSATNAANSAETAKQAETAATQAATSAAADANAAAQSEANASKSASAAAGSATAASDSATAAAGSAETAQTAATTATDAAGQAQASQTAAESAKTAAASSASAAADSATSAQTHATTAQQAAETATSAAETAAGAVSEQLKEDVQGIVDNLDGLSEAIAIKETATGEVISVSDSADYRLLGLKLYGKSVQDGVPTPESPVEIENVMNPTVVVAPKNLINYAEWSKVDVQNGTGIWKDFGIVITSGEAGDAFTQYRGQTSYVYEISVIPGITYTISWGHTGSNGSVYIFPNGSTEDMVQMQTNSGSSLSYTAKEGDSYITFRVGVQPANSTATYKNVMLSIDSDTTFVPYGGDAQTLTYPTPNGLPGIPVESGGNYTDAEGQQWICDEVDFGRGKYIQNVYKLKFNDYTLSKSVSTANDLYIIYLYQGSNVPFAKSVISNSLGNFGVGLCNYFTNTTDGSVYKTSSKSFDICNVTDHDFNIRCGFGKGNMPTLEDAQAWFASHDVYVYYWIATPIETDLTPEQITAYAALTTYKPHTTITTDSDPAAGVSVNYVADTKTYIDNKIASISEAILGGTTNGNV